MSEIVCRPIELPPDELILAAQEAVALNPDNHPVAANYGKAIAVGADPKVLDAPIDRYELAVLAGNYWPREGMRLPTYFLDNPNQATRRLILEALNLWRTEARANLEWVETANQSEAIVRIDRSERNSYWSYVGPQQKRVPSNQPTMMLGGVTEAFRDWFVVTHEGGHSGGFQHEQLRPEIIARIIRQAAYDYFWQTSRWSRQLVDANVLTPPPGRLIGSTTVDEVSIMCYSLPGSIMVDGVPVRGGQRLSATDRQFAAELYPLTEQPPPPPPPPSVGGVWNVSGDLVAKVITVICPDRSWKVVNRTP